MSGYAVKRDSGLFIGDVQSGSHPTGTLNITENGRYNVAEYTTADVDVAQDFTVNESYDISEGKLNGATITLEGDITAHIPDGVTTIGDGAFEDCTSLTSIIIPDSVTSIGDGAFYGCASLTSIIIPDSITIIGDSAFGICTSLTSITIPDGVTKIGEYAFKGCTSLTSITIPDSVTMINDYAFKGCTSLTDIYYTGTQAEWEQITKGTSAIPASATIHYEYVSDGSDL